jgi:hypothetical protein
MLLTSFPDEKKDEELVHLACSFKWWYWPVWNAVSLQKRKETCVFFHWLISGTIWSGCSNLIGSRMQQTLYIHVVVQLEHVLHNFITLQVWMTMLIALFFNWMWLEFILYNTKIQLILSTILCTTAVHLRACPPERIRHNHKHQWITSLHQLFLPLLSMGVIP